MKSVCKENFICNNNYYIYDDGVKYSGKFSKIYDFVYFYIVEFTDVVCIQSRNENINKNINKITKYFNINNYYYNEAQFYIPEMESLLWKQILRQKITDEHLVNVITSIYN
jgi:hypothetical protein